MTQLLMARTLILKNTAKRFSLIDTVQRSLVSKPVRSIVTRLLGCSDFRVHKWVIVYVSVAFSRYTLFLARNATRVGPTGSRMLQSGRTDMIAGSLLPIYTSPRPMNLEGSRFSLRIQAFANQPSSFVGKRSGLLL